SSPIRAVAPHPGRCDDHPLVERDGRTALDSSVHVSADQSQCYELFASLCFEISETGRSEVQAQLDEVLDECATSTYSDPGDSPIGTRSYEVVGGQRLLVHRRLTGRHRGRRMAGPGVQHSLRPGHRQRYQTSQRETWLDDEPVEESAEATIRGQLGLSAHRGRAGRD